MPFHLTLLIPYLFCPSPSLLVLSPFASHPSLILPPASVVFITITILMYVFRYPLWQPSSHQLTWFLMSTSSQGVSLLPLPLFSLFSLPSIINTCCSTMLSSGTPAVNGAWGNTTQYHILYYNTLQHITQHHATPRSSHNICTSLSSSLPHSSSSLIYCRDHNIKLRIQLHIQWRVHASVCSCILVPHDSSMFLFLLFLLVDLNHIHLPLPLLSLSLSLFLHIYLFIPCSPLPA